MQQHDRGATGSDDCCWRTLTWPVVHAVLLDRRYRNSMHWQSWQASDNRSGSRRILWAKLTPQLGPSCSVHYNGCWLTTIDIDPDAPALLHVVPEDSALTVVDHSTEELLWNILQFMHIPHCFVHAL